MSNQIVISSGAKVRNLDGVLTGTSGIVNSVPLGAANGVATLDALGKVPLSQLPASIVNYLGTWNAATNTPFLTNGVGDIGDLYICNVAGTVDFGSGPLTFAVGDWVIYNGTSWEKSSGATGTVTSVAVTESGDALSITGSPITTSGTINIGFAGTTGQYVNGAGGLTTFPSLITSIGLSMPTAFNVANSPLTANGTIAVTGAGTASQYIRGDGQLATFPTTGGGGSSIYYYLNGSISASVAGYKQMSNTAVVGAGTDFNLTGNGLIAQFLTDVGNPNTILIPSGAWNFEVFFSSSSNGGNEKFYLELLKYNGSTFTTIASTATNPEAITGGTTTDLYITSMAVPETTLVVTDRLAVRVYIVDNSGARTITLHTEDNNLCQITTTFSGGISSINGLTANTQYFAVGTSGSDFNINSLTDTHTFNLPTASASIRGALSSTDWSTFNSKQNAITLTTTGSTGAATLIGSTLNIPNYGLALSGYVPYTGATANVNLGSYTLTAGSIIKNGGTSSQFLKADGSVDSNTYLTTSSAASGYVTLDTTQSITGSKTFVSTTFTAAPFMNSGVLLSTTTSVSAIGYTALSGLTDGIRVNLENGTSNHNLYLPTTASYNYTFPAASGTIALLGDIPSLIGYIKGSGTTNYVPKFTASDTIGDSLIYDSGTAVGINTNAPYESTQFSLDVNGGFIVKKTSTKDAQIVLINSNPLTGGNNGFMIQTVGGVMETSFVSIQGYYGTSVAGLTTLRLNPSGGVVLVGSSTAITGAGALQVAGDVNISGSFKINGVSISSALSGSGTTNFIPKFTGSTSIGNSSIQDNGTTTTFSLPISGTNATFSSKLLVATSTSILDVSLPVQINASPSNSSYYAVNNNNTYGLLIGYDNINGYARIRNVSNTALTFDTNNTEKMRITAAGRMLLGTTTDNGALLQVAGSATFSSSVTIGEDLTLTNVGTAASNILATSTSGLLSLTAGATSGYTGGGTIELVANDRSGTNTRGEVYISAGNASANTANGFIALSTANTERLRVTYTGNVGIGTSSPSNKLEVQDGYISTYHNINADGAGYGVQFFTNGGGSKNNLATIGLSQVGTARTGDLFFSTSNAGAPTERMRITSSGLLCIGTTSAIINESSLAATSNGNTATFKSTLNGGNALLVWNSGGTGNIAFFTGSSYTAAGTITSSGTTTSYNTSSDYRLKSDYKDYNALELVSKIKTYNFAWNLDNTRMYGAVAHELQEVIPYSVQGEKDGEEMQGVDYSKIVPVLVKAIQEQQEQIQELKALILNK